MQIEAAEPVGPWISLNAARRLPAFTIDGNARDLATLHRYASRGSRGVVLRTVRIGGQRCTTEAWVNDFILELSNGKAPPAETRAPSRRLRMMRAAESELAAAGI